MDKITLIKLVSGEFIIGSISSDDKSSEDIELWNPRTIQFMASPMGQVDIRFMPICMFTAKEPKFITIQRTHIVFQYDEEKIQPDLVKGYRSHISGIHVANTSDLDNLKNGELIF